MPMTRGDANNRPCSQGNAASRISVCDTQTVAAVNQRDKLESELILRVRTGDTRVFYELVRPYERSIFLAALSLVKNEADAEDVSQEAVLKAFKYLSNFRHESKFSTWLIQITINEAKMKLRKDRRHLYESLDEDISNDEGDYIPKDFADWRQIPSEALQQKELRKALAAAMSSLPPKYRTVFILRDVQHLSISETAQTLGISEGAVKTRLTRARLQMRDALAPGVDGTWNRGESPVILRVRLAGESGQTVVKLAVATAGIF